MKRNPIRFACILVALIYFAGQFAPLGAQDVAALGSTQSDQAVLNFDIATEPQSTVTVEFSRQMDSQNWLQWSPPVTAVDESTPVSVVVSDMPERGFFRIIVQPPRVLGSADENGVAVELQDDGIPPDEVLLGLGRALGETPNVAQFYDPDAEETVLGQLPQIKAGTYLEEDVDALGERLGWRLWLNAPEKDDPAIGDGYQPPGPDRGRPVDVPGDGGDGTMDDGWKGDSFRPLPEGGAPLDPTKTEMKFDRSIPIRDLKDLVERDVQEFGMNVRVQLHFDGANFRLVRAVGQNTGSGVLNASPRIPPEGWFILMVTQFGATHLYPFEDPRFLRAYDPPEGGAHGYELRSEGARWLTIPIFNGQTTDIAEGLKGTDVRVLRVVNSDFGGFTLLQPWMLQEFQANFREVYKTDDGEIVEMLQQPQRPASARAATQDPEVITLHRSGSNGDKFNIAVIGEGFDDTAADQDTFNNYVDNQVLGTLLTRDIHPAILNGINLFRIHYHPISAFQ